MMGSFRMQTNDGIQVNLNKLREMFPNCVSEAKDSEGKTCLGINEEAFKEMFGIEFGNAQETFGFNWVGKSKSPSISRTKSPIGEFLFKQDTHKGQ